MAWLGTWAKRIRLTIDHNDIDAALSDFPILVYLSALSGRNAADVSCVFDELQSDANRKKIAVTKSDGTTECYVEIEKWDHASEKAWLWVKVPSVSNTADTDLYLYYDKNHVDNDTYVGDPSDAVVHNVWDSNFKLVTHMGDDPDTSHVRDSTVNASDGTKKAAGEPAVTTNGKIDDAQDFAENSHITIPQLGTFGTFTYGGWFKSDDAYGDTRMFELLRPGIGYLTYARNDMRPQWGLNLVVFYKDSGGTWHILEPTFLPSADTWYHIYITYNGTTIRLYIDGIEEDYADVDALMVETKDVWIGAASSLTNCFDGIIDEIRISDTARPTVWIKASHESERDHLLDFGGEEAVGGVIIGGPQGWAWQATLDAAHHGSLVGPANAHRHSDLANIGIDDHHARDHATRHQNGGADEVSVAGLSGLLADDQHVLDAEVTAIIAAKLKAASVTDTTGADGKISVTFAEVFASTPVVIVQLEGDVDYYSVITAKNANGFTVKILKTAHLHAQGNTGGEAAHTHGISFASGTGSAHHHSVPNTSAITAGTPAGSIGAEAAHTHGISFASGSGSSHRHSNPSTSYVSAGTPSGTVGAEAAHTHGISFASGAGSAHHHTNPNTSAVSAGTPSGSISSKSAGIPAGTVGGEAAHTHGISFTSGAGSAHHHTNPNTSAITAGTPSGSISSVSAGTPSGTVGAEASHTHTQGTTGVPSAPFQVVDSISLGECALGHTDCKVTSIHKEWVAVATHHHSNPDTGSGSSHTHSFTGNALATHNHTFTGSALGTHSHTIGNTGDESTHTHGVSGTSGAGSSHTHSFTGNALATHNHTFTGSALGTHSHTIADTGNESAHTHSVSGTSGAGSSHNHSFTGSALDTHRHTQSSTGYESAHTHTISGTSGAGSSHNHSFTGNALGTHSHTIGNTGNESAHTHTVSGTSGAGSNHSHTNPNTSEVDAGNALVTTAVTFSYIAMIP